MKKLAINRLKIRAWADSRTDELDKGNRPRRRDGFTRDDVHEAAILSAYSQGYSHGCTKAARDSVKAERVAKGLPAKPGKNARKAARRAGNVPSTCGIVAESLLPAAPPIVTTCPDCNGSGYGSWSDCDTCDCDTCHGLGAV